MQKKKYSFKYTNNNIIFFIQTLKKNASLRLVKNNFEIFIEVTGMIGKLEKITSKILNNYVNFPENINL